MGDRVYQSWLKTLNKSPDAFAIRDLSGNTDSSFAEIQEKVEERIKELSSKGEFKNRVVAFQLQNSDEWISLFLACQALNAIAMPIDPDIPSSSVRNIAHHVKASALLTSSGLFKLDNGSVRRPACLIKLTSGSTGEPRPLFFDDQQMMADGKQVTRTMGIKGSDSNLATIPFGHSYGLGNLVMPLVMLGCSIHLCREPFPHSVAATIKSLGTTVYPTVPAILKAIIRSEVDPEDLGAIRLWISAGSPLEASVATKFRELFGQSVHNFYGSSETGGIAYDKTGKDTLSGRSVGKPLNGVRIQLSKSGRLMVESEAVVTRGNSRSEAGIGQFLLPDITTILNDGSIRLAGRRARIVKLAGKRLSLAEVEKSLMDTRFVDACYVDEYKDAKGRTRVGCVLVCSSKPDSIRQQLESFLPKWKIPSRWIALPELPTNARGKMDRIRLQKIIHEGN